MVTVHVHNDQRSTVLEACQQRYLCVQEPAYYCAKREVWTSNYLTYPHTGPCTIVFLVTMHSWALWTCTGWESPMCKRSLQSICSDWALLWDLKGNLNGAMVLFWADFHTQRIEQEDACLKWRMINPHEGHGSGGSGWKLGNDFFIIHAKPRLKAIN